MSNLLINRFSKTKSVLSLKQKETGESVIDEQKHGWFGAKIHAITNMICQIFFNEKSITIMNLDTSISWLHSHRHEILLTHKIDAVELKKDIEDVKKIFKDYLKTPEASITQKNLTEVLLLTEGRINYLP